MNKRYREQIIVYEQKPLVSDYGGLEYSSILVVPVSTTQKKKLLTLF